MKAHLDAAVWFVNREGGLITCAQPDRYPLAPYQIDDFNPAEIGNSQYSVSDYHGYFAEDMITVIAPVIYEYSPEGYLLIHKDSVRSQKPRHNMLPAIWTMKFR